MNRPEAAPQAQQTRVHRALPTRNPPRRGARWLPGRSAGHDANAPRWVTGADTAGPDRGRPAGGRHLRPAQPHVPLDAVPGGETEAELRYLTDIDHHDHEALAALHHPGGHGLGVARYIRHPHDPQAAEIAIAVVDDWHRRGLGTELMAQLSDRARRAGIGRLTALMSAENVAMAGLLHTMRAALINREADTAEYQIILAPNAEHHHEWRA